MIIITIIIICNWPSRKKSVGPNSYFSYFNNPSILQRSPHKNIQQRGLGILFKHRKKGIILCF